MSCPYKNCIHSEKSCDRADFIIGIYRLGEKTTVYTRPLARLIEQLQRLPGVGPKTAQRLALHISSDQKPRYRR
jgi:3-methyladenine DNA glycosylase/8-oxoguanine DNA glycosylase